MGGSRPGHLEGSKDHEAKMTTTSRELWGHAPWKMREFWVSETAFPGEIPTYTALEALN